MAGQPQNFQAFTIKFDGLAARIITDITVYPAFDPVNPPTPLPAHMAVKALWDTGATRSVISAGLAKDLGLTPVGTATVNHYDGSTTSPTHVVNFVLPNHVTVAGVLVTEGKEFQGFSVIVGMDVLGFSDFSITNVAGKTWMSFRTPSCDAVDYVAEANRIKFAGVGRNDSCPCGSGKKFKKCHGAA